MKENITAMYARKNFGSLLDKTALLGTTHIIERAGRPMAALVAIDDVRVTESAAVDMQDALEKLIKRIKGDKSKKLSKAIAEARAAAEQL